MTEDEIKSALVDEAQDDWIDLFHAMALVKIVEGGEGREPLLRRTGPLIVDLVREGRLVCGEPALDPTRAFEPWPLCPAEAAAVVEDHVRRVLGGEQSMIPWEPCSFALPEYVRTRARGPLVIGTEAEILDEGRWDWVSFAVVTQIVGAYEGSEQGPGALSWRAVEVVSGLVLSGDVVAGDLTPAGFHPWPGEPHEVVERIRRVAADVIARHGYIPLAEVCWFATPELIARAGR
jgi:hypothetical protein